MNRQSIIKYLLSTTSLVALGLLPNGAKAASFDLSANSTAAQTLGASETGNVQSGVTLNVTAGDAVTVNGNTAVITNSGTIKTTTSGVGINVAASKTGASITNNSGATISAAGGSAGLSIAGTTVTLSNAGTISSGTGAAILSVGDVKAFTSFTNTGTISSGGATAIDLTSIDTAANAATLNFNNGSVVTGAILVDKGTTINIAGASNTITGAITSEDATSTVINFNSGSGNTFTTGGTITNMASVNMLSGTTVLAHNLVGSTAVAVTNGAHVQVNTTRTAAGTYTQTGANSRFIVGVTSNTTAGKLTASGAVDLTGSKILVSNLTSSGTGYVKNNTTFDVLAGSSLAGLATGAGNIDSASNTATRTWTVSSIAGNTVTIKAARTTYNSLVSDANQVGLGAALEALNTTATGDVAQALASLDSLATAAAVDDGLKQLTNDVTGGGNAAVVGAFDGTIGAVSQHMTDMRTRGFATGNGANSMDFWIKGFGAMADQDRRDGVDGFDADTIGIAVGVDGAYDNNTRVGVSLAYARSQVDADGPGNKETDIDSYQVSLYGGHVQGDWIFDGLLGFGYNRYDSSRTIVFGGTNTAANADYHGNQYTAKIGGSYIMPMDGFVLVPNASLRYTMLTGRDYTETGAGGLSLSIDNKNTDFLQGSVGAKARFPMKTADGKMTPEIRAAILGDFLDTKQESLATLTGSGTSFTNNSADNARVGFNVGAGLDFVTLENATVSINYDFEGKSDFKGHSGFIRAQFPF
ncbi:MAG: autotransporter domain-containing protein [Dongiaceae bacterium]